MKKAYLYCDKRSLNDATTYYVNIVMDCLKDRDYEIHTVFSLKGIEKPDLLFTLTEFYFVKAKLKYPFVKTIVWQQGVGFEEAKMTRPIYKWLPFYLCEMITVLMSDMKLFVSDKMCEYYHSHYHYNGDNYVVMPCYNLSIGNPINIEKYKTPTFVYAGSISKWQGIDVILDTYALIEKKIPNAQLFMYVKDKDFLLNEAKKRGINNLVIKYVPLNLLQSELQKYKYGFILREKNWVNFVATPTKMNSYLAAYLIPIFSDGVDDFKKNIKLGEFTLIARTPLDSQIIASQIIEFEKKNHDYNKFNGIVHQIFHNHYNDTLYKKKIISKMIECGI